MDGVGTYRQTDCFNMDNEMNRHTNGKGHDAEKANKRHDDYEPYDHRNVKDPVTYFDTLIHLMKASLGTGILSMPLAFKSSGYVVGTIGTVIIGFLCTYTVHLLVSASYELCRRMKVPSLTYPETSEAAFLYGPQIFRKYAPHAKILTKLFLILYQVGASCVYIIFIATNIKLVIENYLGGNMHVRIYMLCLLLPMLCIASVRNLKLLAPFSSFANIVTLLSFGGIFYYIFRDKPSFLGCQPIETIENMPTFFNIVLFAMEAIGMVLPLENEMENPRKFGSKMGVLNVAMVPVTCLYTLVGLFGYMKYGMQTEDSITFNLGNEDKLAQGIKLFLSMAVFIGYGLSNYVAYDLIWSGIKNKIKDDSKVFCEYGLRACIVFITFFFAVAIPNLGILIGLIGALCLSIAGIGLPAVISFLTYAEVYKKKGRYQYFLFCSRNMIVVLIAIFALIIGVTMSVNDIIQAISSII